MKQRISVGGSFLAPASDRAIREMMRIDSEVIAAERRVLAAKKTTSTVQNPGVRPRVEVRINAPRIQTFLTNRKKKVEPSF